MHQVDWRMKGRRRGSLCKGTVGAAIVSGTERNAWWQKGSSLLPGMVGNF